MLRKLCFSVVLPMFLLADSGRANEEAYGTAAEAKAMLEKAVAALKDNQAKALQMFIKGEAGFKDRDLYPFCGGPDGKFTAHPDPKLLGQSLRNIKDENGKPVGEQIYASARENQFSEVTYFWPRPGEEDPMQKAAFVTKVGDQVCGVGYYGRAFF